MMLNQIFSKYSAYGTVPLRVALGLILVMHGFGKFFGSPGIGSGISAGAMEGFASFSGLPGFFYIIAAIIELGGGILILAGLFTRLAALVVTLQFIYISFWLRVKLALAADGSFIPAYFGVAEFDLLILAAAIALLLRGAGKLSVEKKIFGKEIL